MTGPVHCAEILADAQKRGYRGVSCQRIMDNVSRNENRIDMSMRRLLGLLPPKPPPLVTLSEFAEVGRAQAADRVAVHGLSRGQCCDSRVWPARKNAATEACPAG